MVPKFRWLSFAASFAIGIPATAQIVPVPIVAPATTTQPDRKIEGATAERVARIEQCQGHKFDTRVEIDPVSRRTTRIRLCADPGASDADWVKTLRSAIAQIEQRAMPDAARQQVIAELRQEIVKFAPSLNSNSASASAAIVPGAMLDLGREARARSALIEPVERFETSIVPPLPAPLPRRVASVGTATTGAPAAPRVAPMRFGIRCLSPGETGAGSTCDFLEAGTVLVLSAVDGMEKGSSLLFRRRGEARGQVEIAPLASGNAVRVRFPKEVCRGVANTRIELELLAPGSASAVAGRAGPYDIRC